MQKTGGSRRQAPRKKKKSGKKSKTTLQRKKTEKTLRAENRSKKEGDIESTPTALSRRRTDKKQGKSKSYSLCYGTAKNKDADTFTLFPRGRYNGKVVRHLDKRKKITYTDTEQCLGGIFMQPIHKEIKKSLLLALLLTLCLPLGGVLLGVGLGIGQPAVWAIGIAGLVIGFYGCPIGWVGYGNKCALRRLVDAIEEEHLYTVKDLSAQLGVSEKEVLARIDVLFKKRYLLGYRRTADGIELNENKPLSERESTRSCPSCGAKVTFKGTETTCPYCGTHIQRD